MHILDGKYKRNYGTCFIYLLYKLQNKLKRKKNLKRRSRLFMEKLEIMDNSWCMEGCNMLDFKREKILKRKGCLWKCWKIVRHYLWDTIVQLLFYYLLRVGYFMGHQRVRKWPLWWIIEIDDAADFASIGKISDYLRKMLARKSNYYLRQTPFHSSNKSLTEPITGAANKDLQIITLHAHSNF